MTSCGGRGGNQKGPHSLGLGVVTDRRMPVTTRCDSRQRLRAARVFRLRRDLSHELEMGR